jgi:hypothetical protein
MLQKIKDWIYLNYGVYVPIKIIRLVLILIGSALLLLFLLVFDNLSSGTGSGPGSGLVPGGQVPGAPSGIRYVNPSAPIK